MSFVFERAKVEIYFNTFIKVQKIFSAIHVAPAANMRLK